MSQKKTIESQSPEPRSGPAPKAHPPSQNIPLELPDLHWELLIAIGLVALTVGVYTGTWDNPFINFNDPVYVTENPGVQAGFTGRGLAWDWTTFHAGAWQPLTWMSLQLDYLLYGGPNASGFHLTNLLLHCANVVLLFGVLLCMTGHVWPSALVAALFAVHPLQVETVAWVAERNNLLSTFFGLLTLAAYIYYILRPSLSRYLPVIGAFVLSLLAMPLLAVLPVVLLLLDWWPLRRFPSAPPEPPPAPPLPWPTSTRSRLIVEKVPLLAVAIAFAVVGVIASLQAIAQESIEPLPLTARLANAVVSYWLYLGKTVWPMQLAVLYPHPISGLAPGLVIAAGLAIALITVVALAALRRLPYLAVGWLWFLIMLMPVSGLLQAGPQSMADRFTYVANIGIYIVLAWGLRDVLAWRPASWWVVASATTAALIACLVLTRQQLGYWRDSATLWQHTLAVTGSKNALAHIGLGKAYWEENKRERAKEEFTTALGIVPGQVQAHIGLGEALFYEMHYPEAAKHYEAALKSDPRLALAHNRLGMINLNEGKLDQAANRFSQALAIDPGQVDLYCNLGVAYYRQGKIVDAIEQLQRALEIEPNHEEAHNNMALCYLRQGKLAEAANHLNEVLRLMALREDANRELGRPASRLEKMTEAEAQNQLGVVLGRQGNWPDARARHQDAIRIVPDVPRFHIDLAFALDRLGEKEKAKSEYQFASQLDPNWQQKANAEARKMATDSDPGKRDGAEALRLARQICESTDTPTAEYLDTLAAALAEDGQFDEAVATARKALETAAGQAKLTQEIQERLRLYQERKPFRATDGTNTGSSGAVVRSPV